MIKPVDKSGTHDVPGAVEDSLRHAISPIEEIIEEARNGRLVILVDHEDRENEGDLYIPAEKCKPDAVNFMATHGRGLICLTLTSDRVDALGLPPMARANSMRHETAFTVSIEAREGVTTGISAYDRATTIAVAIDPEKGAQDLASPGHIFPLRARDGGVLVRAGHTEAAVDVSRLAGLNPSGVICEIMNDDGHMSHLPELIEFGKKHGLKIGAISDLIAYRRRHDNLISETHSQTVTSAFGGEWMMRVFTDQAEGIEHVVLTKGDITTPEPVLVRTHALRVLDDVLGINNDATGELNRAMEIVAEEGRGAVCLFRDPHVKLIREEDTGPRTIKQIGLGAQILSSMGLHELVLLTDNPQTRYVGLDAYDLHIVGTRQITKA
ncbi:3,4-dihydroxy-2-butanone 4-phosphate synthase [Sulfitobacter noctilucicola]|uniref:3,4-dihydroxy-2-butanone 4-phosphate synthase n=1 Tax=Sulfitobacter noctilucicola TaxID=1342301 RepID=A0A7W6MA45_9RHOB|nr:3,4-dihydroxy-2-butanone-4-phosphate synthase [Sulfitobacter noctilucicola]KIN63890.1 3,4-dihydroxy-2-butanone 4-phosphate synthase [Sulfitobacter noctilucicola]MBB4175249.1 3,4-dihydroxy 2-butanone 4-phosphate synthase/GTP cyclohydrolase II [Sulfitobacter noctilucicola]